MFDVVEAEGISYTIMHFKHNGFIHFENAKGLVFAYHSAQPWGIVRQKIYTQWGKGLIWNDAALLRVTSMKNGKNNYVFEIFW